MDNYDDIVIGSGLAALGTVMGLPPRRRVLVLGGDASGAFSHYDAKGAVPCAYSGQGGLGGYWHGVIPMSQRHAIDGASATLFSSLLRHFYPRAPIDTWLDKDALFVPWKPIRPTEHLAQLVAQRGGTLVWQHAPAQRIEPHKDGMLVHSEAGTHHGRRVWVAAGALHTPRLLARTWGTGLQRAHVADHVLCYVGQTDTAPLPQTHVTRDGVFFPAFHDPGQHALYTLRPARFAFRQLDYGIEQRAAFGLPTGNAVAKIMRSMSPGLLAEAFYNRFGLFAKAPRYSIYAQAPVDEAYVLGDGPVPLQAELGNIQAAAAKSRQHQPFAGATLSRRPDLYIPGIHLYHSLDMPALHALGLNRPGDPVQVVDAAGIEAIGPAHHSFRMLCAAYQRAQSSS